MSSDHDLGHALAGKLQRVPGLRVVPTRLVRAATVFVNGFVAVGTLAVLAMVSGTPLVFPSVGPTAFLLFFQPNSAPASAWNTLCGHAIGILCGYAALRVMHLTGAPSALLEGVNLPRVMAAALSLAGTGALMVLLGVVHPPAGATTLIVSLGFITAPAHLAAIEGAVVLLVAEAYVMNDLTSGRLRPKAPP